MFGAAARTRAEPDSKSARDEMLFWLALTSVARLIVTSRAKRTFQHHICTSTEKTGEATGQVQFRLSILLRWTIIIGL